MTIDLCILQTWVFMEEGGMLKGNKNCLLGLFMRIILKGNVYLKEAQVSGGVETPF